MTNHGGFISCQAKRTNKHITLVVAISASGRKVLPFFIVEGKIIMSGWQAPLIPVEIMHHSHETIGVCTNQCWEDGTVIMTSDKGSMEKRLIYFVIEHVDRDFRKEVPPDLPYCMTLDEHSSWESYEWLQLCKKKHAQLCNPHRTRHIFSSHATKTSTC